MKKLDDISKENIFQVPDGYFEKLPGVIQARVAKPTSRVWFSPIFKFAVAAAVLVIVSVIWFTSSQNVSVEEQLGEIQTDQLMAYLEDSEVSTDLINEEVSLNEDDLNDLEEEVFSSMEPFDITAEELSVESNNF